jgi:hypothetical protein
MAALAIIIALQIKDLKKANIEARRRKVRTNKLLSFKDRFWVLKISLILNYFKE